MSDNTDVPTKRQLKAHLQMVEITLGECATLLQLWRVHTPYITDTPPDAVVAILNLQDQMRSEARILMNMIGEEHLPFSL